MNYRMIFNTLGWVMNIEAMCMILPLLCALIYGESLAPFAIGIIFCLVFGIIFTIKSPKNKLFYPLHSALLSPSSGIEAFALT